MHATQAGPGAGMILLGKYRIESVLGRGAMGVVLRATHLGLGEQVAIKVLLPEAATGSEAIERFMREAQSAVRLRGEHITRVSDVGLLPDGAPYIVMEYLHGSDLAHEIARRGAMAPGEAADLILQACEALAEAHAHGMVHRDIKPGNLFLTTRADGSPLLKVLDFGISKSPLGAAPPRSDTMLGSPAYMSPEQMQASKAVDARTDVWSLGIVLYECLHGCRPFESETFSGVVYKVATEPPAAIDPRIPRRLQAVLLRCLTKEREARYGSVAELAIALAPFARDKRVAELIVERTGVLLPNPLSDTQPAGGRDATTTLRPFAIVRQRPTAFAAGVLVVIAVVVLVAVLRISGGNAATTAPPVRPSVTELPSPGAEASPSPELVEPWRIAAIEPRSEARDPFSRERRGAMGQDGTSPEIERANAPATSGVPCETPGVKALVARAANLFSSGDPEQALRMMEQALTCKQDGRMYLLAATYACVAHDAAAAKRYFALVPPQHQSSIAQRCEIENIELR